MNHCVPDWNMGDGSRNFPDLLSGSNQKKSMGPDHELVELLWRNGQVILNSQTHRKPNPATQESKQVHKAEQPFKGGVGPCGNSSNSIQDDEAASWLQYPLDDSLEKFCSDFFYEMPTADSIGAEKLTKEAEQETNIFTVSSAVRSQPVFNQSNNLHLADTAMPPPKFQISDSILQHPNSSFSRVVNFSHFSRPIKANLSLPNELCGEKGPGNLIQGEVGESSMVTINGSHCGSNQVQSEADLSRVSRNGGGAADIFVGAIKEDVQKISIRTDTGQTDTLEPTVTSSSGGSGGSFGKMGKQTASNQSHKRKGREADESECQSEEAEYESIEASKPVQRSMSARRSRAAEVHNLSERRRRDRINEKMKALQELIPHCNKSDKASMLDEAIEYLKSLQMQVQIMWMGSGMAPMMFPGVQHYISRMGMSMGMGMGNGPLPPIHSPVQFPKVPLLDPSIASVPPPNQQPMCPSPALNSINFQNQMQNSHLPEAYARYLGFHSMQSAPQAMNLFGYGSQTVQQSQKMSPPSSSGPYNGGGKLG